MQLLRQLSHWVAKFEMALAALMALFISVLILVNVVSRALGMAIYWIDELAIYAMIWMTFLATSVVIKKRQTLAVTFLVDQLPLRGRYCLALFSDVMILGFALLLAVLCYRWYDPWRLFQTGFDVMEYQSQTFNFIYSENTNTLGLKKVWVWMCLPWVAFALMIHSSVNVLDRLLSWRTPEAYEQKGTSA